MILDPLYLIVSLVGLAVSGLATMGVKSAFAKYSRISNRRGLTGAEAARLMLQREGLDGIAIEAVKGWLSDHYSPSEKTIRLSPEVYTGRSIAAVSIACHEAGHALQHQQKYVPLGLRSLSVPLASIGGGLGPTLCIIGIMMGAGAQAAEGSELGLWLVKAGLLLFGSVAVFQLITLPVEFNASRRAKAAMLGDGILTGPDEASGGDVMLRAAAMTYVAALVTTLLWLLYFAMRAGLLGGRRRN